MNALEGSGLRVYFSVHGPACHVCTTWGFLGDPTSSTARASRSPVLERSQHRVAARSTGKSPRALARSRPPVGRTCRGSACQGSCHAGSTVEMGGSCATTQQGPLTTLTNKPLRISDPDQTSYGSHVQKCSRVHPPLLSFSQLLLTTAWGRKILRTA